MIGERVRIFEDSGVGYGGCYGRMKVSIPRINLQWAPRGGGTTPCPVVARKIYQRVFLNIVVAGAPIGYEWEGT